MLHTFLHKITILQALHSSSHLYVYCKSATVNTHTSKLYFSWCFTPFKNFIFFCIKSAGVYSQDKRTPAPVILSQTRQMKTRRQSKKTPQKPDIFSKNNFENMSVYTPPLAPYILKRIKLAEHTTIYTRTQTDRQTDRQICSECITLSTDTYIHTHWKTNRHLLTQRRKERQRGTHTHTLSFFKAHTQSTPHFTQCKHTHTHTHTHAHTQAHIDAQWLKEFGIHFITTAHLNTLT